MHLLVPSIRSCRCSLVFRSRLVCVRSHLSVVVVVVIECVSWSVLVFDRVMLVVNMCRIFDVVHAHEIRVLFVVKSFVHAEVFVMVVEMFDGFDVVSSGELVVVGAAKIISVVDPIGVANVRVCGVCVICVCETSE